jgi:hypothetical protein
VTAVARIALARVPARETPEPRRLHGDAPSREFGEDLAEERTATKQVQVPTAEQLALAGIVPIVTPPQQPAIELPVVDIAADIAALQVGQLQQIAAPAAPKLALVAPTGATDDEPTATPLEQAVIDLLDRSDAGAELVAAKPEVARDVAAAKIAHAAPIAEPRAIPQQDAPTSHVNLVLDEGEQRVVVTVAVRGNDVNVQLRGGEENVAASLARNAGSLDEALRMRGLSLGGFTASRDPEAQEHERPQQHERREQPRERFTLEENI